MTKTLHNDFYSTQSQGHYHLHALGEFALEEGEVIPNLQLAYATYGMLNESRDNVILIPTWFSGSHQTWELAYIAPGRALDPEKYFIVAVSQIGNGLSSSPHNVGGDIAMSRFPRITIGDDVRAQEALLRDVFEIDTLALVVGGSMGAQQTYEWAVRFPDKVKRAAPIAGTAQVTPHNVLLTRVLMDAITSDPGYADGDYASHEDVVQGLRRHADLWAVIGFSTEFWKSEFWRTIEIDGVKHTNMQDFHRACNQVPYELMDPNSLLSMAWKWQHADVARHTDGDLAAALARITARTFVLPIDEDMFFPPRDCIAEQRLIPNSEVRLLHSVAGHSGLGAFEQSFRDEVDSALNELLALDV